MQKKLHASPSFVPFSTRTQALEAKYLTDIKILKAIIFPGFTKEVMDVLSDSGSRQVTGLQTFRFDSKR